MTLGKLCQLQTVASMLPGRCLETKQVIKRGGAKDLAERRPQVAGDMGQQVPSLRFSGISLLGVI